MADFLTGQHLLAVPEIKRYVLVNTFSNDEHLVTERDLQNAFGEEYVKIIANRHNAWFAYEYFD